MNLVGSSRDRKPTTSVGLLALVWATAVYAQDGSKPGLVPGIVTSGETRTALYPSFQAGGFRRFLFGNNWRALWTSPVPLKVLDLQKTAGGLAVVDRGAGHASRPFDFRAPDGTQFGFRVLVKDATLDWPPTQRSKLLTSLAHEQISGTVPGGALAVAVIERAVGASGVPVELVALPDDSRLGVWQAQYAGKAGTIEVRLRTPEDSADDLATGEFLETDQLFERLRVDPTSQVDARAFLAARLVDILVGDWDRHEKQWAWAEVTRRKVRYWVPVSSDRDWAFNNLDGLFWGLYRNAQPRWQHYDAHLSGLGGLIQMSRPLDRRLLVSLDKNTWDSVTSAVVRRIDDRVISRAIDALPAGMDSATVTRLEMTIRARRDHLAAVSSDFYSRLSGVVEIWGTNGPDRVRIENRPQGRLLLTVERGAGQGTRWSREFVPGETQEIRVYLLTGADRVTGKATSSPIRVRVIHEGGGELAIDSTVHGIKLSDSTDKFRWPMKRFDSGEMLRDWGGSFALNPWIGQKSGAGIIIGGGPVITKYDFRRVPYLYKATLRAAYATSASTINLQFKGDYRFLRPGMGVHWDSKAFLADAIHYFGIGNETPKTEVPDFYLMRQHMYRVEPALYQEFGKRGSISIGPVFSRTVSDEARPTLALEQRPYGFGSFTEFGAAAGFLVDLRDDPVYPVMGLRVEAGGRYFPALADVVEPFGVVSGQVSGYLGTKKIAGAPVLAVRAGGAKGFGSLPFFEAPMLGGKPSLRGFSRERFNGDGSVYGSAELRFNLGHFKAVLPGEIGVYGLGDIGRIYRTGETSTLWHKSYGAGLWFSFYDRATTVNLTWARSVDGNKFYLASGFHF